VLHLEPEIPRHDGSLTVGGNVTHPTHFSARELSSMPTVTRQIDLHCTWGWSRKGCSWEGLLLDQLLERTGIGRGATHVQLIASSGQYQTCLTLAEARAGIIAFALDGTALPPEHGAPMRFVVPASLWQYKGPKWLNELRLVNSFQPGFWEVGVNDPAGRIPKDVLDRTDDYAALREALVARDQG
jgi:DMSO/TMAO reductase YedYZ molybdopterin-dependent catalytic subunit